MSGGNTEKEALMSDPKTYDCFVLHSLLPAPGWQAVYDVNGTHEVSPIYALALATRRRYYCHTAPRELVPSPYPEDEIREIVGLDYDPSEGFTVWDEISNFCGCAALQPLHNPWRKGGVPCRPWC